MLSRPRHCSKGVHPVTKSVLTTSRGKIRTCVLSHCSPARNLQTAAPAEASGCEQLASGCYSTTQRPGIELATIKLQIQCPNHQTTEPP